MKLGELAAQLDLPFSGDADFQVNQLAPIESACATDLAFVVNASYRTALENSQAGAVIVPESLRQYASGNVFISSNPYASYAKASWILKPDAKPAAGIHETASVSAQARLEEGVSIGAFSSIGAGAIIKQGACIGEHCVVSDDAYIGAETRLFARVSIGANCVLGQSCRVQSGAVIGSEGFGYAFENGWHAIHQTGRVTIGNNVHIGANTTIDRGAIDDTVISDGVILDNQIQIAHNVYIGKNTAIAGCVGIAGSTRIGANCQIGGACNIVGHISICDGVVLNATSFVSQSITQAGRYSSGMPLQSIGQWRRSFVVLGQLEKLLKRVRKLEQ